MIRSLRNNFIRVMILALLIVMILLIGIINVVYVMNIYHQTYDTIDFVKENHDHFQRPGDMMGPESRNSPGEEPQNFDDTEDPFDDWYDDNDLGLNPQDDNHVTPDTKFETSYFIVNLDSSKNISAIDHGYIASVSEEDISEYAEEILASGKEQGRIDYFLYKVCDNDDGTSSIVAVSCYQQFRQARNLFSISILAGILYMAAVFALVWFMSKRITRPVEESYQKQRQFITDAGHELKTPITIIKANTEVLEMQAGKNQWIDSIKNQTSRLTDLVQSLLELSKLNEKDVADISTEFDLSKTILDAAETFRVPIEAEGKALVTNIQEGILFRGSRDELYRLTTLLMDNALKYSNDRLPIQVDLKKQHHITFSVSNSCDHIDSEKVSKLFERFYRADESRSRKTGGSGIGLSVAQAIVERHKGTISANTDDEQSICFAVVF